MPATLRSDQDLATPITCVLCDVDGVMTDGRIIYDAAGVETKAFHVRDGLGIKSWIRLGHQFGIITARNSPMVDRRAGELGIEHVSQGPGPKLQRARDMLAAIGCDFGQVCYIGDDVPDVPVMRSVALAAAPADAATDARETAHWVLRTAGGHGVVREVIERLMRAQGNWNASDG